ncbi:unnamed protein product, partial [Polarella glacialis]
LPTTTCGFSSAAAILCGTIAFCGWATPSRQKIRAPVQKLLGWRVSALVSSRGRASETWLRVLAHLLGPGGAALSLVGIRIATGRRHQIRIHSAHVGHPTVCDGRYTATSTFLQDRQWCNHTFLHRYRLAFLDDSGARCEAVAHLPGPLQDALGNVRARD